MEKIREVFALQKLLRAIPLKHTTRGGGGEGGGYPTLKLAKPPLEVQLSVYRPKLEPFSFNTYPPLEEIF